MTFLEVIKLIGDRGEKVISDKSHTIQTDKRLYARNTNGDWEERETSLTPEKAGDQK